MKKTMKKLACLALAFVMALSIIVVASPSDASAASVKKVTATKSYKKAPALKTGNNKVTMPKNWYYVKYKAPKKGTYVFTFTNIQSTNANKENGFGAINLMKWNGNYMQYTKVKTNGGKKCDTLWICTNRNWKNGVKERFKDPTTDYTYKRTATITLKKGETIYITGCYSGNKTKYNFMVNVKKK